MDVPAVQSLTIEPANPTVYVNDIAQLNVVLRDEEGRKLKLRAIEWWVDDQNIASVSATGRLRGVDVGQTRVHARSEGVQGNTLVTVPNRSPVVTLNAPADSTVYTEGKTVTFSATASDPEDGSLSRSSVVWASSLDGQIGTDTTFTTDSLSVGDHLVRVTATDSHGDSATDSVAVTVTAGELGIGFGDEQFVLIEAGSFEMGDITGTGDSDELPVHTVNITQDFYLQKTEVTQAQWQAVMGTNPSYFSDCGETCPVETVSWHDVQAFINSLNVLHPGRNYRLPTEAEWEYAARAGTTGDYGGTGVLDEMGWYSDNSGETTHPVAQKLANDWGLYDMHGNVWEWVQDWYASDYYSVSQTDDPQGPSSGSSRVVRGGSWVSYARYCRSANRDLFVPSYRYDVSGFRLARTP